MAASFSGFRYVVVSISIEPRTGSTGWAKLCPTTEQVAAWFGRPASLALLLAQCGHLRSIEADRVADPDRLDARTKLA